LGTKPTALLTVEQLIWQCVCRVANGGDAASEIRKLCKEYNSLMKHKEKESEAITTKSWFSEGEIIFFD
jgi:hypothetical protein